MLRNASTLFDEIRRCAGKENCWGKMCLKHPKPVVLPCKQQPKVMIITEQMNKSKKEKELENVSKDWDPSKELLDLIYEVKKGNKRIDIILRLTNLFDGKFLEDFDDTQKSFNRFYWTHFIKCPGNLRDPEYDRSGLALYVCADTFLLREIEVLRPELIVCMGSLASTWILKQTGLLNAKYKWLDLLLEELEWAIKGETQILERKIHGCGHKAKIVVLPHPSRRNPLAAVLNKKLKSLLKPFIDSLR